MIRRKPLNTNGKCNKLFFASPKNKNSFAFLNGKKEWKKTSKRMKISIFICKKRKYTRKGKHWRWWEWWWHDVNWEVMVGWRNFVNLLSSISLQWWILRSCSDCERITFSRMRFSRFSLAALSGRHRHHAGCHEKNFPVNTK